MTTAERRARLAADHLLDTAISTSGEVTEDEVEYAVDAMSASLTDIGGRLGRCVLRLEHGVDPHHVRRAKVKCSVELDGHRYDAHADGETVHLATDRAIARLHQQLRRHIDRLQTRRRHGRSISGRPAPR